MNSPDLLEKGPAFREEAQSLLRPRERQLVALDPLRESVGNLAKEKCWSKKFISLLPQFSKRSLASAV